MTGYSAVCCAIKNDVRAMQRVVRLTIFEKIFVVDLDTQILDHLLSLVPLCAASDMVRKTNKNSPNTMLVDFRPYQIFLVPPNI